MRILATMAVMILLTLPISMSGRTGMWTSESQCDTTGLSACLTGGIFCPSFLHTLHIVDDATGIEILQVETPSVPSRGIGTGFNESLSIQCLVFYLVRQASICIGQPPHHHRKAGSGIPSAV